MCCIRYILFAGLCWNCTHSKPKPLHIYEDSEIWSVSFDADEEVQYSVKQYDQTYDTDNEFTDSKPDPVHIPSTYSAFTKYNQNQHSA